MKKSINLCVDLVTLMKQEDLQVLDSRKGTLFRNEEDKFTFTERGAREQTVQANVNHIKLELYIPHGDYADGRDLADILASQVDQMGDNLCEMDMAKVVEAIRALKK